MQVERAAQSGQNICPPRQQTCSRSSRRNDIASEFKLHGENLNQVVAAQFRKAVGVGQLYYLPHR